MNIQEMLCNPDRRWHIHEKSEWKKKYQEIKFKQKQLQYILLIEDNKATNFEKRISNL